MAYTKQTFVDNETVLSAAHMDHIEDGIADISYFGMRYSEATDVIDLSESGDESVKMYLFATVDGYDAVVEGPTDGNGAIRNFTTTPKGGTYKFDVVERSFDAEKIHRMHIRKSITSIGNHFMNMAFKLSSLTFEDSSTIEHLGKNCFAYTSIDGTYKFTGLKQKEGKLEGPFESCPRLKGLTFNDSVNDISDYAFQMCLELQEVMGLHGVSEIGKAAFQYCTNLTKLDVVPGNVIVLGDFAFILTPSNLTDGNNTPLCENGTWGDSTKSHFVHTKWNSTQLADIQGVNPDSVQLLTPRTDTQYSVEHTKQEVFWMIIPTYIGRAPWRGQCGMFTLFHIYNILHPNAQYDTYREFIKREIQPKKIEVTDDLHGILTGSEVWTQLQTNGVTYDVGADISITDLPIALDYAGTTYGKAGTAWWGVCEALDWSIEKRWYIETKNATTGDDANTGGITFIEEIKTGAEVKSEIIDSIAKGKPVYASIAAAADDAGHGVAVIGYSKETDKLLFIDSTGGFDHDVVPLTYWCSFESIFYPGKRVEFFDFGEVITMTDIDNKLTTLMASVNSGFRVESGIYPVLTPIDTITTISIPCTNGAKVIEFYADTDTLDRIKDTTGIRYIVSHIGNFNVANHKDSSGVTKGAQVCMTQYTATSWILDTTAAANTNTNGCTITTRGILNGTYHWKAYYWNDETDANSVWAGGSY